MRLFLPAKSSLLPAESQALHGMIIRRDLAPRLHSIKPYGHYLIEMSPGATAGTSLVRVKILAFDWRTKRPVSDAEQLADRFLRRLAEQIV